MMLSCQFVAALAMPRPPPHDVAFQYDRFGRQILAIVAGALTRLYSYTLLGQLSKEIVQHLCASAPLRETILRTIDIFGRDTGFSLVDSDYTVTYAYAAIGRLRQVANFRFQVFYSYLPIFDLAGTI